jgi:hypothetical protein
MEYRNIKVYAGRYDYLFRSSISPSMERAYFRCLREQNEPFLDVKIEPDAFEPFGAREGNRRIFIHLTWFGSTPLTNVRLTPRGDIEPEPRPPTGVATDDQPGEPPFFETIRPGGSEDASLILKQNPGGAKSFVAVSADGVSSKIIAFYQMGANSLPVRPKTISLSPMSTELNNFMRDVRRDCLMPTAEGGELFVSTATVSTVLSPQTAPGRVSSVVLKDPQPRTRQVCFEAQATAPRKGAPAEGTATLEVWELGAPETGAAEPSPTD